MQRLIKVALCLTIFSKTLATADQYEWAVIGAGPAGIISVAILLENGIQSHKIAWIDPVFEVGRLGKYYGNVPSNQMAYRFTEFLNSCDLFKNISSRSIDAMKTYDQQKEPMLQLLVDALQDITHCLKNKVSCYTTCINGLKQQQNDWLIQLPENEYLICHKVILAHGSKPKKDLLNTHNAYKEISLDIALDESKLKKLVSKEDKVMVVGSSHSALLILKFLSEFPVKQVISLYTKHPVYGTVGMHQDIPGIEGITARWCKEILEKNPPKNLMREYYTLEKYNAYAEQVDKIVYAYGFCQNSMLVDGSLLNDQDFDPKTGIIRSGLFGIGIAFPELFTTQEGKTVPLAGVNAFIKRAQELMPEWIRS